MSALFADAIQSASRSAGLSGWRSAALMLQSVSDQDREWLLSRLSAQQQAGLAPLMAELQTLGMAADAQWVQRALTRAAPSGLTEDEVLVQRVASASAQEIMALLAPEPVSLQRLLIQLADWPWRAELMSLQGEQPQWDPELRRSSEGRFNAVEKSLLRHAAGRLGPVRAMPPLADLSFAPEDRRSVWQRWVRRVRGS